MTRAALPADWRSRMAVAHTDGPADASPSIERKRQAKQAGGKIERVTGRELIDANGNVATPYRLVDTLDLMRRRGTITPEMHAAGSDFREAFAIAQLDTLRAADMARLGGGANHQSLGARIEAARRRVWRDIRNAGGIASPGGSCLWHVLGWGQSLNEWAKTQGWAGRYVAPKAAGGILIAALGVLVEKNNR